MHAPVTKDRAEELQLDTERLLCETPGVTESRIGSLYSSAIRFGYINPVIGRTAYIRWCAQAPDAVQRLNTHQTQLIDGNMAVNPDEWMTIGDAMLS